MKILISTVGNLQNKHAQQGFTYVMVLAAIVIMGILAGVADTQLSMINKREREEELLFRGMAYREAIRSYYESGRSYKSYPRSLKDLVNDPRFPMKHHIRRLYAEPISQGGGEWLLIRSIDGGIAGVTSPSTDKPLKKANFPVELANFNTAKKYTEWRFEFTPGVTQSAQKQSSTTGVTER